MQITDTFTGVGAGKTIIGLGGDTFAYSVAGTFVATVVLEESDNGGLAWKPVKTLTAAATDSYVLESSPSSAVSYRFRVDDFTSGSITAAITVTEPTTGTVDWDDVTGKPATFPPAIGTTADTALAGNTPLLQLGTTATTALAGNTAIPAASTTAPAALATAAAVGTGTTFARADHVHAIPGASVGTTRGTVLIQTAIADLTADPTMADFNGLLAKLRSAGVLSA